MYQQCNKVLLAKLHYSGSDERAWEHCIFFVRSDLAWFFQGGEVLWMHVYMSTLQLPHRQLDMDINLNAEGQFVIKPGALLRAECGVAEAGPPAVAADESTEGGIPVGADAISIQRAEGAFAGP